MIVPSPRLLTQRHATAVLLGDLYANVSLVRRIGWELPIIYWAEIEIQ